MIAGFGDKATEDIYQGLNTKEARKIPQPIWKIIRRKLDMINAARELKDLAAPPGNRLEALKGNLKGFMSVRVNDQYRVVFEFYQGEARKVQVKDYH